MTIIDLLREPLAQQISQRGLGVIVGAGFVAFIVLAVHFSRHRKRKKLSHVNGLVCVVTVPVIRDGQTAWLETGTVPKAPGLGCVGCHK